MESDEYSVEDSTDIAAIRTHRQIHANSISPLYPCLSALCSPNIQRIPDVSRRCSARAEAWRKRDNKASYGMRTRWLNNKKKWSDIKRETTKGERFRLNALRKGSITLFIVAPALDARSLPLDLIAAFHTRKICLLPVRGNSMSIYVTEL